MGFNHRNMLGFPWKFAIPIETSFFLFRMKSKKNLTRFTYENAAFEGWRLCISRAGTTFTKYFPDKKYGGPRKALNAAEQVLKELKELLDSSKRVKGKLSQTAIRKGEALLSKA